MVKPELLTYMKQVMDLETALYTNQRLNDGLTESVKAHMPVPPQKPRHEIIDMPHHPEEPQVIEHLKLKSVAACILGIPVLLLGIGALFLISMILATSFAHFFLLLWVDFLRYMA